jgi:L-histidine Nalpha-methyltransferase
VLPLCADFTHPLRLPAVKKRADRRVVYFPGSTIGNFTPTEVHRLLHQTAMLCEPGGGMLLGVDLPKDRSILEAAYNDDQGVTAAFNLNILVRINRELEGDFVIDQFAHRAFYNPDESRIEMHLVSLCDQWANVGDAEFFVAEGESIHTENSYKYSLRVMQDLAEAAGLTIDKCWKDTREFFAVLYLKINEAPNANESKRGGKLVS